MLDRECTYAPNLMSILQYVPWFVKGNGMPFRPCEGAADGQLFCDLFVRTMQQTARLSVGQTGGLSLMC